VFCKRRRKDKNQQQTTTTSNNKNNNHQNSNVKRTKTGKNSCLPLEKQHCEIPTVSFRPRVCPERT
jgi:hypothetical protein